MASREPESFQAILERLHGLVFMDSPEPVTEAGIPRRRRTPGADEFTAHASHAMDQIVANLPHLAKDFFAQFAESRSRAAAIMREDTWHLASTPGLVAFVRLSKAVGGAYYASGNYSLIQNIDTAPIRLKVHLLDGAIDEAARIFPEAREIILAPGGRAMLDGTREVAGYVDSGMVVATIVTANLANYDATFDSHDGHRIGRVMADLQTSAVSVALRVFAAAGWEGATDLAVDLRRHPVKEVRWSILNYLWRSDVKDDRLSIGDFLADPDPEIRGIAAGLMEQLRAAEYEDAI